MTNLETATNQHSTETTRRATKTSDGEGDAYWFYGDRAILRSPEGALPIIIEHHVSPGGAAPLHVHLDVDDSFLLLSGTLAIRSAGPGFCRSQRRLRVIAARCSAHVACCRR